MDVGMPAKALSAIVCFLSLVLLVALASGPVQAQGSDPPVASQQSLPYDEAEAQGIDRMLMCPVCPAESIDQAQVEISRQMRRLVREMLAQGASREEILKFFADRYGQGVLAAPPKSGINLLAWIVPIVGVVAALGAGLLVIRSMTGRDSTPTEDETISEDNLTPYLDAIDRDLGLTNQLQAGGFPSPVIRGAETSPKDAE